MLAPVCLNCLSCTCLVRALNKYFVVCVRARVCACVYVWTTLNAQILNIILLLRYCISRSSSPSEQMSTGENV